MQLTYKFKSNPIKDISNLCVISNNLYNQANFIIKEELNKNGKWIRYNELNKIMRVTKNLEGTINYFLLKAQSNQQILKLLDKNWKSFFKSLKEFKKNPNKFKGLPRPPKYLKKNSQNILIYTNQNSQIKNNYLILSKSLKIYIPQFDKYKGRLKRYQQVRILPKKGFYEVEIVYNFDEENRELDFEKYGSIDLGINNLVTLVTEEQSIIYNGKPCKSVNQFYNKTTSQLKSIRDNKKKVEERRTINNVKINKLLKRRNDFVKDYFHKVSRHLVNYLLRNKIGNLVVGINRNWKDSITLGKKTNQSFLLLPHSKLISFIRYKCQIVGIRVVEIEESYTSKCDSLALEKMGHQEKYLGKRVKRGLFQSSVGRLINADVNGTLNILRKVVGDCQVVIDIINRGFLFNPIKVSVV